MESSEISIGLVSFPPARPWKRQPEEMRLWPVFRWSKETISSTRNSGNTPTVIAFKRRRLTSHYPPTRQHHIANILLESIYGMPSIGNNFNLPDSLWKRQKIALNKKSQ